MCMGSKFVASQDKWLFDQKSRKSLSVFAWLQYFCKSPLWSVPDASMTHQTTMLLLALGAAE